MVDRQSAYEILNNKIAVPAESNATPTQHEESRQEEKTSSVGDTIKAIANSSLTKTVFREVTRGLLGVLIGKPATTRRRSRSLF